MAKKAIISTIFNNLQTNTCDLWKHQNTKTIQKYLNSSHDKEYKGTQFFRLAFLVKCIFALSFIMALYSLFHYVGFSLIGSCITTGFWTCNSFLLISTPFKFLLWYNHNIIRMYVITDMYVCMYVWYILILCLQDKLFAILRERYSICTIFVLTTSHYYIVHLYKCLKVLPRCSMYSGTPFIWTPSDWNVFTILDFSRSLGKES